MQDSLVQSNDYLICLLWLVLSGCKVSFLLSLQKHQPDLCTGDLREKFTPLQFDALHHVSCLSRSVLLDKYPLFVGQDAARHQQDTLPRGKQKGRNLVLQSCNTCENSATKKHIQCMFIEKEHLGFLWFEIILYKQRLIELFGSYVKGASPGIEPESAKARHSNRRLGFTTPPLERPDYTNPQRPEGSAFCKFWPENSRKPRLDEHPHAEEVIKDGRTFINQYRRSTFHHNARHTHTWETYPTIYTTINGKKESESNKTLLPEGRQPIRDPAKESTATGDDDDANNANSTYSDEEVHCHAKESLRLNFHHYLDMIHIYTSVSTCCS
ncbi:hypothetical protein PROFUN_15164 [Planoprotostelium fungivorum]|uniref:Uncharacterized protein n=1 Tax=Planoprotostelium fungivorum TaxID=1890364 RepID=A0A2P6MTW9_9EUKA|nr:hypothetical protein PROFUN_15164 [Planoprotostelium fungivorum]